MIAEDISAPLQDVKDQGAKLRKIEGRIFLSAHDEAVRVWRENIGPDGFIVRGALRFARAQERLYATAPWSVLGIDSREFANPNRQAYGR